MVVHMYTQDRKHCLSRRYEKDSLSQMYGQRKTRKHPCASFVNCYLLDKENKRHIKPSGSTALSPFCEQCRKTVGLGRSLHYRLIS